MRLFASCFVFLALLCSTLRTSGFVLIGPMPLDRQAIGGINLNYVDDLGGPKAAKEFFRWNIPHLTYAFDASFITYFGLEGREAVREAFTVVNDFFDNKDYQGVTALNLSATSHGYAGNFNTQWENQTAKNSQIVDLKSLTLGMVVNQLGLGNPHRYMYGIHDIATNQAGTQLNFNVRLRNYDPITYRATDVINNVKYSYRLIHDAPPSAGVTTLPTFADMEEFVSSSQDNAWTSVAAITDSFYGNTAIYWTDMPSKFGFGAYYHRFNAMGGKYEPRHALTYDDAGGLKYLYRKNNYVYENLDPTVVLITPVNLYPIYAQPVFPSPTGQLYPSTLGGNQGYRPYPGFWGRRNGGFPPAFSTITTLPTPVPPQLVDVALRGGIDKIQFSEQPFDSFLGVTFTATNMQWTDTFVTTNGVTVGNNGSTPGSTYFIGVPTVKLAEQVVGRGVFQPDIIFVADELGVAPDGVPIAWNRTDNSLWIDNFTNNLGPVTLLTTNLGPGIISGPVQYTFSKLTEGFEVIWSGEASVVGNTQTYSMWGHITGPGPNDFLVFPTDARDAMIEETIAPSLAAPTITRLKTLTSSGTAIIDANGAVSQDPATDLTRTEQTLSIVGTQLAGVTTIEFLDANGLIVQTIYPAVRYIKSDQRIDIPPGILDEEAEGAARQVRAYNSVGSSNLSTDKIAITTGRPVLQTTSADGYVFDRGKELVLRGYGFKSITSGETQLAYLRVDNASGSAVYPADGNTTAVTFEIVSDREAVLRANSILGSFSASADYVASSDSDATADGSSRRLRVARKNNATGSNGNGSVGPELSLTNGVPLIAAITAKPVITPLGYTIANDGTKSYAQFRRDGQIDINGTALNTAYKIEIVNVNQSSFSTPVAINLPNAGVKVEDNGTRILIAAHTFLASGADGNATDRRRFKVYHTVDNAYSPAESDASNYNATFTVNTQPTVSSLAAFSNPGAFNRAKATGDDIIINGFGLKAVDHIEIVDANGTPIQYGADGNSSKRIDTSANGVTVTDTTITIDTSTVQFDGDTTADSNMTSIYRRFKLVGLREAKMTPIAQKFLVGAPPTYSALTGSGTANTFRRDNDTLILDATHIGYISKVEIVDASGQVISGATALASASAGTLPPGVTSNNATRLTVAANAFTTYSQGNLLDSVNNGTRRLRVSTPFGTFVSSTDDNGSFSVSATPAFAANNSTAFAGGGYNGGTGVYDRSVGNLVINGTNFRGVKTIYLTDSAGNSVTDGKISVNPASPPAGITFNAAGTQITLNPTQVTALSGTNFDGTDRRVYLESAADQNITVGSGANNISLGTVQP